MKKLSMEEIPQEKLMKINIINPLNKKEFSIDIHLKEKTIKNEIDSIIPYIISLNDKINKMEKRISIHPRGWWKSRPCRCGLRHLYTQREDW